MGREATKVGVSRRRGAAGLGGGMLIWAGERDRGGWTSFGVHLNQGHFEGWRHGGVTCWRTLMLQGRAFRTL